jgi:hypothetical protein
MLSNFILSYFYLAQSFPKIILYIHKTEDLSGKSDDKTLHKPKFKITRGEPLVDRESTFQAYLTDITSKDQVDQVLTEVYVSAQDRKIAVKKLKIAWAYRMFCDKKNSYTEKAHDDLDKNHFGGQRLLSLLQTYDAENDAMVIVICWPGNIPLGRERYVNITKCAEGLFQKNVSEDKSGGTKQVKGKGKAEKHK